MRQRLPLAALLWLCLVPVSRGQSYLPPAERVMEAIEQQAEVLAADERAAAAGAQARALALGGYEFEASLTPQQRRTQTEGNFDEFEVQLSRQFRLPGKAPLDREIGSRLKAVADLERNDTARAAAQRLLELWMQWLRTAAMNEEAQTQQRSLQTEQAALARRVQIGDAAQLELDLINAELAQARAMALRSTAAVTATQRALNNDFPQIPLPQRAPSLPDPTPLVEDRDAWIERIVSNSYELQKHQQDAARQEAVAARASADRIPDPNIGLRLLDERDGQERSVGLVFSMPLGSRHRRELATAEHATALALKRDTDAVRRNLAREAHSLVVRTSDALAQWQAQQQAREAMASAAARVQRAWELGEIALTERLLAERRARETAYQELAARADAHEAQLRVRIESQDLWHLPGTDGTR